VLQADWRARLAEHDLEREALDALVAPSGFRAAAPSHAREELEGVFVRSAGEHGLTEKENTFTRANVVAALATALPRGVPTESSSSSQTRFLATRACAAWRRLPARHMRRWSASRRMTWSGLSARRSVSRA